MSRVFAISGFSGTGKTTLVKNIVKHLTERGYSVGTVKSSKHDILPPEGTDTFIHLKASAHPVVLLGPSTTTIRYTRRLSPSELLERIDADIIVFEGFKSSSIPRVWCVGDRTIEQKNIPDRTHAIISWKSTETEDTYSLPVLQSNAIEEIVDIIEKHAVQPEHVQFWTGWMQPSIFPRRAHFDRHLNLWNATSGDLIWNVSFNEGIDSLRVGNIDGSGRMETLQNPK